MSPPLKESTARFLVDAIKRLGAEASFGRILLEANREGVLAWHRTLRRYLDLLVLGQVLEVEKRNVGSVNPQQLYTVRNKQATVWAGPRVLKEHGLNRDSEDSNMYTVETDLEGLVRSKPISVNDKPRLAASLEDSIICEIRRDKLEHTGGAELATALLATRPVDLPYLLRRSDKLGLGTPTRLLIRNIVNTFTSLPGDAEGSVFLSTRENFLRILRQYSSRGYLKLLDSGHAQPSKEPTTKHSDTSWIITTAAKQLGVSG